MNPFVHSTSNRYLLCSVLHQILYHKEVEGLITILRYLIDTNIYFYLNDIRYSGTYNVCAKFLFLSSTYISIQKNSMLLTTIRITTMKIITAIISKMQQVLTKEHLTTVWIFLNLVKQFHFKDKTYKFQRSEIIHLKSHVVHRA